MLLHTRTGEGSDQDPGPVLGVLPEAQLKCSCPTVALWSQEGAEGRFDQGILSQMAPSECVEQGTR